MKFSISEVNVANVYCITHQDSKMLARMFMRLQEHYESSNIEFRNKPFSRDEFKTWYAANQSESGTFSYYSDWSGFNIPSNIVHQFRMGDWGELHELELKLLKLTENLQEPYYLIGVADDSDLVLEHEIAHGLYYTNETYRTEVNNILGRYRFTELYNRLRDMGYGDNVLLDEVHAYLVADEDWLHEEGISYPMYLAVELQVLYNNTLED